jgi:hypothetical protein
MIVFAILVALAALSWLGSLAYAYFTNPIERSRLNKRPAVMMIALLAAVSLVAAHRHLLAIRQPLYFDWRATDSNLGLWINRMRYFHGARFFDETQIAWGTPLAEQEASN